MDPRPTAITHLAILASILLPCCTEKQVAGGGGAHPTVRIDTRLVDQAFAIEQLDNWLIEHGFQSDNAPWKDLIGEPATNSTGEVINPEAFIKRDSNTASLVAWGIALPTETCRFIDVFHFTHIEAKGNQFETLVSESEAQMRQFQNYIKKEIQSKPAEQGNGANR